MDWSMRASGAHRSIRRKPRLTPGIRGWRHVWAWPGPPAAITAAGVSMQLTILVFHRWLSYNLLINVAIIGVVSANG
jgi:hypothetical protein